MAAKLIAEEGILKGLTLKLEDGNQWVIGRDPDACQLLVEDPAASRKHLICRATPEGIFIENLSETNPVQVNEKEIKEPRLLRNGDAVKIGDGTFRFYGENGNEEIQVADLDDLDDDHLPHTSLFEEKKEEYDEDLNPNPKATELERDSEKLQEKGKIEPLQEEPSSHLKESTQEEEREIQEKDNQEADIFESESDSMLTDSQTNEEPFSVQNDSSEKPLEEKNKAKEESNEENRDSDMKLAHAEEEFQAEAEENSQSDLPKEVVTASLPTEEEKLQEEIHSTDETAEELERHDSIFDHDSQGREGLAEINFGLLETGRWLLKVINGPNNGAEFSMQTGNSYIIGTDPNACDIVFHDTSVSRQHSRITVSAEDTLTIEDLRSRNGTLVDREKIEGKHLLLTNSLVSIGTTSFVVFDREGEMQTIISPLMPSIVKVLQTEEQKKQEQQEESPLPAAESEKVAEEGKDLSLPSLIPSKQPHTNLGAFILIGILTGLFAIVGIGTSMLFKSEPVPITQVIDTNMALSHAMEPFSSVKYTFNKNTGQLLLVGHVLTVADKSQLMYSLQGLTFIKSLDDSGVIIDEYVWREINQVLERNPYWKGINVMATTPGHFVVSGYLQTRNQADRLSEYLSANFPYPDLLEKRTVVDEEVIASINAVLQNKGLRNITAKLNNGEVTLTGGVEKDKSNDLIIALGEIKEIRGVRSVKNSTAAQALEESIINISDKYEVTGISRQGGSLSVVINGRILMKGDILDGMTINAIQPNRILLEKEDLKYRIDF